MHSAESSLSLFPVRGFDKDGLFWEESAIIKFETAWKTSYDPLAVLGSPPIIWTDSVRLEPCVWELGYGVQDLDREAALWAADCDHGLTGCVSTADTHDAA